MKNKLIILLIIISMLGVCAFALDFLPLQVWPTVNGNSQHTGQNLKENTITPSRLNPMWIYPNLLAGTDYIMKTLDSDGVTVVGDWADSLSDNPLVSANDIYIRSKNTSDKKHFKYIEAERTPADTSYISYKFDNLRVGDKYQMFLAIPSKLVDNKYGYKLANTAFVNIRYQDASGQDKSFDTIVNMSREQYAGAWIYISGNSVTVGKNKTIEIRITNKGYYQDNTTEVTEDTTDLALMLADAVRIVRLSNREMVGSPVSLKFQGDSLLLDTNDAVYNSNYWGTEVSSSSLIVKNTSNIPINYNLKLDSYSNPINDDFLVYAPSSNVTNVDDRKIAWNFNVNRNGKYDIYVNILKFATQPASGTYNFENQSTQSYDVVMNGASIGSPNSISVTSGGWKYLGTYSLNTGKKCSVSLLPTNDFNFNVVATTPPQIYVADAVRIISNTSDFVGAPVGMTAYNRKISETPIGSDWDDATLSAVGIKNWGDFSAFNIRGGAEVWHYANNDASNWEDLEGPVSGGFATSPTLSYMKDPKDNRKEVLAAFVGGKDGVFYAFDVTGTNFGESSNINNSRLLFKGPGIFLSESKTGVGTSALNGWSKSATTMAAYGGNYLYTTNLSADPIKFTITDLMRTKAGDITYYNTEKGNNTFNSKAYSSWNYKVKMWIPPVLDGVGVSYNVNVSYYDYKDEQNTFNTYTVLVEEKDLGTWKDINVNDNFKAINEVSITPKSIPTGKKAILDNIWCVPSLPAGEDYAFGDASPVVDIDAYNTEDNDFRQWQASRVFATTAAGRIWTYDLNNGLDTDNKIGRLVWTFPKIEDRKFSKIDSTPAFYANSLVFVGKRIDNKCFEVWNVYTPDYELNFPLAPHDIVYSAYSRVFYSLPASYLVSDSEVKSSVMVTKIPGTTYPYFWVAFGSSSSTGAIKYLHKGSYSNNNYFYPGVRDTLTNFSQATPTLVTYGDPNNPTCKLIVPDINGVTNSFEVPTGAAVTTDTPSAGFTPTSATGVAEHVYSSVVTDGVKNSEGNLEPNAYLGLPTGYMSIFNAVSGSEYKKLIAGIPTDEDRRVVKSTPQVLDSADIGGEGLVNINGADGYNYTYSIHDYTDPNTPYRDDLAFGADWAEIFGEAETTVIDPANFADEKADLQMELIDFESAQEMIKIIDKKSEVDSLYSNIISTDKTKIDSVPDNTKSMLSKSMRVIPKDIWNYIMTGDKATPPSNNVIDTRDKSERLRMYLLRESQKERMNIDFSGNKISGNDSRALFWELDNASGELNPRQNDKGINLEWGDKIYLALWNIDETTNLNGTNAIVFEYNASSVPLTDEKAYSPIRRIPASVTKQWVVDPYTVMFENPITPEDDIASVTFSSGATLKKKMIIVEVTLDYNYRKIQTMIGSGWKLGVDLIMPKQSSRVVRIPIAKLKEDQLAKEDPNLITPATEKWLVPFGNREEFAVNNPLSLKVNSSVFGKSYVRYEADNLYNGVPSSSLQTVKIGDFSHGYLTTLKDVAQVSDRSMKDLDSVRFYPYTHSVDESTHGEPGHVCNFIYNRMPWEYWVGSADYPPVDYKNVTVVNSSNEDMVSYDSILSALKPWTEGAANTPYLQGRTGNVTFNTSSNVKYQIDIPRYQPALKAYVADAVVYVDSNGNGRFDKSGTFDTPSVNDEAYRRFQVSFGVVPQPEILVEEDTFDIGEASHGLGYPLSINGLYAPFSEGVLGLQQDVSYNPYNKKPEIMRWYKPFKVINDGNVNLYDVSLLKQPLFANNLDSNMSMLNEGILSSNNYDNNWKNTLRIQENDVVSSLDNYVYSDVDNNSSANIGVVYPFSSNRENFGETVGGKSHTITKPRVGDTEPNTLTIPDTRKVVGRPFAANGDYNRILSTSSYELDVRDVQEPMVSVAVPLGQPVGEYSTKYPILVTAKYGDNTGGTVTSNNGFNLNVNVKEAQITGKPYDKKSAYASLYNIGGYYPTANKSYYAYDNNSDNTPFAYQRANGNIGLLWSNNMIADREGLSGLTDFDTSKMPLNIGIAQLNNKPIMESRVKATNEVNNFFDREAWWDYLAMSIKENGWPDDLPTGYSVPLWNANSNYKSSWLLNPSYYTDGTNEKLVFAGRAELAKDGKIVPGAFDNRIFYMDYSFTSDPVVTPLMHLDSKSEKKYPIMSMKNGKNWFFWQSSLDDKSLISYTTNDLPTDYASPVNGYCPESKVRLPSAISSAGKPNLIDRDPADNIVELIYTGVNKITGGTDIYMSQYSTAVNTSDMKTFGLSERALPLSRVYDELRRDSKFDFYVAKGLAWLRQDISGTVATNDLPAVVVGIGGAPADANHSKYIDVFTGNAVSFNKTDWVDGNVNNLPLFKNLAPAANSVYPKFSFDNATGVMTIEYAPNSDAYNELGKTLVDFSSGVIRFTRLKDISESVSNAGSTLYKKPVTVYASYVPQTINLTLGSGINDGGYAIYDSVYDIVTVMWRKTAANTSNGVYYKIFKPSNDANGKLKYTVKYDDKKVSTDTSITSINDNSVSGFFDENAKGNNDKTGYGKLWLFWSGTKSGTSSVYYSTEAIDESFLF